MTSIAEAQIADKVCTKCETSKPLTEFFKQKDGRYGRQSQCKDCKNPNRRIRKIAPEGFKECSVCRNVKRIHDFNRNASAHDGLQVKCKDCQKVDNAKYYAENIDSERERIRNYRLSNADYILEYARRYGQEHPDKVLANGQRRRALRRGAEDDGSTNESVIARWGSTCYLCSVVVAKDGSPIVGVFNLEHVVPLSKGGSHTIDNLRPSCAPCNNSKYAKTLMHYIAHREPAPDPSPEDEVEYMQECGELDSRIYCVGSVAGFKAQLEDLELELAS